MSTSFKNKLFYFISGQLPEYIVAEYPQFVQFLTSYYKFLETSEEVHDVLLNNASWKDIDNTLDMFLPEFKKQYASDIPDTALLNIRRLIKYISEYYEAKGSENAAELFFRFMYNEKSSVVYPGDYTLRASDGKWSRKKIIKIDTVAFSSENIFELTGKQISFKYMEFIPGEGSVLRNIQTSCFNVVGQIEPNIYQLEVDINPGYVFPDVITPVTNVDINNDGVPETIESLGTYDTHVYLVFNNNIYGSISKQIVDVVSIDVGGSNFRVDDSYLIGESGIEQAYFAEVFVSDATPYVFETFNNNAVIRIQEITPLVQLPSPYVSDVELYFASDYVSEGFQRRDGNITEIQIVNTGQKFAARQEDNLSDIGYFAGDYAVNSDNYATDVQLLEPTDTFTVDLSPRHPRNLTGTTATITFRTGLIRHAEGIYKDSSGFLSDINRLQDNYYYQPYSYVIRSQQPLSTWKNVYTQSNHPAGFKVFSELQFTDVIPQTVSITEFNLVVNVFLLDTINIADAKTLNVNMNKTESLVTSESVTLQTILSKLDTVTIADDTGIHTQKTISDSVSVADDMVKNITVSYNDVVEPVDNTNINIQTTLFDIITVTDTAHININGAVFDETHISDNIDSLFVNLGALVNSVSSFNDASVIETNKSLSDVATIVDVSIITIDKSLSDMITTVDAGSSYVQSYFSEDYFAENYVGSLNTF